MLGVYIYRVLWDQFASMLSLQCHVINSFAHGRRWCVMSRQVDPASKVQQLRLALTEESGSREWHVSVVSARVTPLKLGDFCMITSVASGTLALAWYVCRDDDKCWFLLASAHTVLETMRSRPDIPAYFNEFVAHRNLSSAWKIEGMPSHVDISSNQAVVGEVMARIVADYKLRPVEDSAVPLQARGIGSGVEDGHAFYFKQLMEVERTVFARMDSSARMALMPDILRDEACYQQARKHLRASRRGTSRELSAAIDGLAHARGMADLVRFGSVTPPNTPR